MPPAAARSKGCCSSSRSRRRSSRSRGRSAGRGTKLVPATNLDVVIVLDYSKSMYARDVAPSRIARAKAEIGKLVRELPGARFGAVAFAGEPMSFPLTSDSAAIAQFFRQLEPNDMPIGGTAIGRALERAREVLARDPKSKDHVRVIVLVTDGEDLEGDPVGVARQAAGEKTRIDVVQIGGRAPEPIPDVGPDGRTQGFRKDESGRTLTTELTAEGEAQLADIAKATGGAIVRAEKGETGIDEVARALKKMMREELAERVEIAFDEEYMWPLGLAILLLIAEGLIPRGAAPAPRLRFRRRAPAGRDPRPWRLEEDAEGRRQTRQTGTNATTNGTRATTARSRRRKRGRHERLVPRRAALPSPLCRVDGARRPRRGMRVGSDTPVRTRSAAGERGARLLRRGRGRRGRGAPPGLPHDRRLLGGQHRHAARACAKGRTARSISASRSSSSPRRTVTASATRRTTPASSTRTSRACAPARSSARSASCVRSRRIPTQPVSLRARARYLEGNLLFLTAAYKEAVTAYDHALELVPAMGDAGPIGTNTDAGKVTYVADPVGRDAAWNRAVALRRIEDKKDAGPDASPPDGGDGGQNDDQNQPDGGNDKNQPDGGNDDDQDAGKDSGSGDQNQDAGKDSGGGDDQNKPPPKQDQKDEPEQPPPPSRQSQDERILDQLENAPTVQQEAAKKQGKARRVRGMADKMTAARTTPFMTRARHASVRARFVGLTLATLAPVLAWTAPARAQGIDVTGSVDANEIELGDTVTYVLQATSTTSDAPSDPRLAPPAAFTVVDSGASPTHMVSIVNGHRTDKHGLTATWRLSAGRLGTFTIGPGSVAFGGSRRNGPAARVTVVPPGQGKPRPRQPTRQPFDPFGGGSPFDPFKGLFPGIDDDSTAQDPFGGVSADPKLALDAPRAPIAFLHATIDKTRAVVGEQVTLNVYLYEDIRARQGRPSDVHEATATDFVKRSLVQDETRAVHVGNAMVGGRPWAVKLVRKNALFPIKTGRLTIAPMSLTLPQARVGLRESETLFVDVSEPPVANRPAGYQIGDTGDFSLSASTTPRNIDQHGAVGVTVELRGNGNMPAKLPTPEIAGVEWLEPQTRDNLGPVSNDRFGGTRTFSYVVLIHKEGAVDLGEIRLPYFDPQTRKYEIARTSLGIVQVAKVDKQDAGPEVAETLLPDLPQPRAALEGKRIETFLTERPVYWGALFGSPLACAGFHRARRRGPSSARATSQRRSLPGAHRTRTAKRGRVRAEAGRRQGRHRSRRPRARGRDRREHRREHPRDVRRRRGPRARRRRRLRGHGEVRDADPLRMRGRALLAERRGDGNGAFTLEAREGSDGGHRLSLGQARFDAAEQLGASLEPERLRMRPRRLVRRAPRVRRARCHRPRRRGCSARGDGSGRALPRRARGAHRGSTRRGDRQARGARRSWRRRRRRQLRSRARLRCARARRGRAAG